MTSTMETCEDRRDQRSGPRPNILLEAGKAQHWLSPSRNEGLGELSWRTPVAAGEGTLLSGTDEPPDKGPASTCSGGVREKCEGQKRNLAAGQARRKHLIRSAGDMCATTA